MRIVSIEPTPSPNNMKLNMDERLPDGTAYNFTKDNRAGAPSYIVQLLDIPGVKGIFQVTDFIAVERDPKADWQTILAAVRDFFAKTTIAPNEAAEVEENRSDKTYASTQLAAAVTQTAFGEVYVYVQMFQGIPLQIKLTSGTEEKRVALPHRFLDAAMRIQSAAGNFVFERAWEERGVRYGEMDDVGAQIAEEITAAYDGDRLNRLITRALEQKTDQPLTPDALSAEVVAEQLADPDWRKRFAALERLQPTVKTLPVLKQALTDEKMSVRRLATAYLGMIEDANDVVLPLLYTALKDRSATVRRTAGDCLSDLGDPAAIGPMCKALHDRNKIVRWRAARYLYEVGDESAISALRDAQDDPEFEVQMQVKLALERIEGGHEAEGTVWQQMTRAIGEKGVHRP
ncbi:virulence factor [Numidum massiliense]|uniref:virulence factor n=1 Tax=Numidum massiliense TaxID=1522315 RepID=UPI000AE072AC|nr:virulence factor [Numidum massiliense]